MMFRIPARQMLGLIVTVSASLWVPAAADELDEAIAREEALAREATDVNDGELELLPAPPPAAVHTYQNRVRITERSLRDGWVHFEQCHEHLDPVAATEIVFHPERVRNLVLSEYAHVGRIIIDGSRVLLEDVGTGARVCLAAESRALHQEGGRFVLRNGPYMRRFLDGYYPLHVSMHVEWPAGALDYAGTEPPAQPGLAVTSGSDQVSLDAWFRGKLSTELWFRDARVSSHP
jgi:hypothetical protein